MHGIQSYNYDLFMLAVFIYQNVCIFAPRLFVYLMMISTISSGEREQPYLRLGSLVLGVFYSIVCILN